MMNGLDLEKVLDLLPVCIGIRDERSFLSKYPSLRRHEVYFELEELGWGEGKIGPVWQFYRTTALGGEDARILVHRAIHELSVGSRLREALFMAWEHQGILSEPMVNFEVV